MRVAAFAALSLRVSPFDTPNIQFTFREILL